MWKYFNNLSAYRSVSKYKAKLYFDFELFTKLILFVLIKFEYFIGTNATTIIGKGPLSGADSRGKGGGRKGRKPPSPHLLTEL